jgi:Rhodopirellula transposase DDE domain
LAAGRVRRPGAGRKRLVETDPTVIKDLERLVDPATVGDPERPLRWTSKSAANLAVGLRELGHELVDRSVLRLLTGLGYTMQANARTREGADHPDRDAQFRYIDDTAAAALAASQPVISVDTKHGELVGEFKAVGQPAYPDARELTITADSGGSNSARGRLWKVELQKLADRIGLPIVVCHFPRGTSKWNKIEHRLFSFISHNWRGKPLIDYATIINLITSTTTSTGLKVYARLDETDYPKGVEVSNAELAKVNLRRHDFHGDWNYTILPTITTVIKS